MSESLSPEKPYREPDWRWRLAGDDRFRRDRPDPALRAAREFRRMLTSARSDEARRALAKRLPAVNTAFAVYSSTSPHQRAALEARILAREPHTDIARKLHVSLAVVTAYCDIYYDVSPYLDAHDHVVTHLIRPLASDASRQLELAWKLFGYIGGALVLDELIVNCSATAQPGEGLTVGRFFSEQSEQAVKRNLAIILSGDPNSETCTLLARLASARSGKGESEQSNTQAEMHIQALLLEIPWSMHATDGSTDKYIPKLQRLLHDAGSAVELRAEEQMWCTRPDQIQDWEDTKAMKGLPPPRKRTESVLLPSSPTPAPPDGNASKEPKPK